ncbi:hypothetical protein UCRPC4_g04988 [Phaeomoniella chlamydospora]|uniref:endo-1,3(4)-beta-glucanase n=1 Tax=Phaeomoniella chlamydospora TaxID=158046 RepID=A0A0G2E7T4_PHACM|nr:hypothetical protein UCRPC4_g04988 [Phaeomoniella chlamydospora]
MSALSSLFILSVFASQTIAGYTLSKSYTIHNFFQEFNFFTDTDPTHGSVKYVDFETANSTHLAGAAAFGNYTDLIYLGVDSANVAPSGRPSTRVSSMDTFNQGLFIVDIVHAPAGICGTWPAFWLLGSGMWPYGGEIDIFEGVNAGETNQMTLHTSPGCTNTAGGYLGSQSTPDCNSANTENNSGCGIKSKDPQTYGLFNENSGGVFATEWTSEAIKVWFWPRDAIPSDILESQPNPGDQSWGAPQAVFSGDCDIDSHFQNMQIIIDTTFCGDWAGKVWSTSSCSSKASTCEDWVAENPTAFTEAFWAISSIEVFQSG